MITKEDIRHVATLARLEFTEEELEKFTPQMDSIINMAEQLAEVDTTGVEPLTQVVDETNVFREDVVNRMQTREELMQNVPEKENNLIKVPTIIDKEEE